MFYIDQTVKVGEAVAEVPVSSGSMKRKASIRRGMRDDVGDIMREIGDRRTERESL